MNKTIGFEPKNFPKLPVSLCQAGTGVPGVAAVPLDDIDVDIDELCAVVWEDSFGPTPTPNPAVAALQALLSTASHFEFSGSGPGTNKETKRSESNKYGKGFCRWLLYKHFGVTYFAHIEDLIRRGFPAPNTNWSIKKLPGGDAPDYFCSDGASSISLGEAKGRLSAVSWTAPGDFPKWRTQFNHVEIRDAAGNRLKIKGTIVAAQMKSTSQAKLKSKLFAEDPFTLGDTPLTPDSTPALHQSILACHYSDVLTRLGHPLHAAYLRTGARLRTRPTRRAFRWECLIPSLQGKLFVGGFYPPTGFPMADSVPEIGDFPTRHYSYAPLRFNLSLPHHTFFGLEYHIYKSIIEATYAGLEAMPAIEEMAVPVVPEGTSLLRDGTLLCPSDFVSFNEIIDV